MKNFLKKYWWIFAIIIVLVGIAGGILFSKREQILNSTIEKIVASQKQQNQLEIKIEQAHFAGLSTVHFGKISVVPLKKDTLLSIRDFEVKVKLLPLLFGDVKLAAVKLFDGKLTFVNRHGVKNYDFLFKERKRDTTQKTELDLAKFANKLINKVLYKVPDNLELKNFEASFAETDSSRNVSVLAKNVSINDQELTSTFILNNGEATWHCTGMIDGGAKEMDVKLFADGRKVEFPYLEQKFGLKVNFDTLALKLAGTKYSGDELTVKGAWGIKNLLINHKKIANKDVVVDNGSIDATMVIGKNFLSLDSASTVHLRNLEAHPFIKFTLKPAKVYELKLNTDWVNAQDFFDAFPAGMFESLEGIKVAGKIKYGLNFYLEDKHPDDCKFDSRLDKKDFKILHFGAVNLQKINGPFVYTPYEYGKPMRNITIGPQNPNFTPYNQICNYLKNAILTAEDNAFFTHKGFFEEAIRKSIATNYKAGSFKRGGSTISMQLVKNVYLSRQKTMARKLEEMLIVWLIENNRLTSKERMFEVYLNIIEWAPNVYGVSEASRFYFAKHPSELNLGESMFLASIIPSPKRYRYQFYPNGALKQRISGYYFDLISGLMLKRGMITEEDRASMYNVVLRGPARNYVITDTTQVDTLLDVDALPQQIIDENPNTGKALNPVQQEETQPATIQETETPEKSKAEIRKQEREERRRKRKEERENS
ncbi:biosynthetic peptidoglycan transglycosylase [Solitalea canadensis]|uniref:Transglycosylase n=1 Tax=Solitalea canadensis (strain ATCC 29591 / DSM 3403 / JCM 21819 / LMG 8368 / NBRC 15130 / NCIMB 12057 / USAM 9D) TaxID=929556 RepID=H8KL47_SOLCM|nr:biosynthetic peptidoglycan transglycosylase [Solitalea canadensis]AFD09130.1 Transglycosylase [Solitalea canadensis DSM 3403]